MKKKIIITSLIGIVVILSVLFFIIKGSKKPQSGPVLVIGLDGADWNIIDPLVENGKLPNLARLINEGSSGIFHTFRPTKSPVIWTSIATGKTMLKHGVLDWTFVNDNDIEIPYSVEDIKVKPIWKILSENNYSVGVLNWFCTFPAEQVNGYLISDRFRISVVEELDGDSYVYPETLMENILPHIIRFEDKEYGEISRREGLKDYLNQSRKLELDIPGNREIQLRRFRRYFLQDKSIENVALHLYENVPVDFFAVYLRLIDTTSHFASLFLEKDITKKWEEDNKQLGGPTPETEKLLYANMVDIIEPVYVYMDNVVGRLLEKTTEDTTVIVISDHGFNFSSVGYNHYDTPVIPHGIIIMKGPGIKPGFKLNKAKVYDFAPTILHHFHLSTAEDMDGDVIREANLKKRKVRMVATYETETDSQQAKKPRAMDKKVLEDLKSLGYIH